MNDIPEALRLADNIEAGYYGYCLQAAAELRRLHALNAKPLTIERLRDALVTSRIIPPAAVEDPDEYDDGVTLFRIEALHRRIT